MLGVTLALVALTWAAVVTQARFDREQALAAAARGTANLAIAFEQYAIRTIEAADGIILSIAHEYTLLGRTPDLAALVEDLDIDRTAYDAISIVDRTGAVIPGASVPPPLSPINIADREHFAVHRDRETGQAFVGRPVQSRRSGREMVPVTRRLNDPDGDFAGIVSVQFDPSRLTAFYAEATQGARDIISLVGRDGITRARRVGDRASTGEDLTGSQLMREWGARRSGTYVGPGGLDGVQRIFSFRTVGPYPLVATVGVAVDDVLVEARAREQFYRRSAAVVTTGVLFSGGLIALVLVRRQEFVERLAASNHRFKGIFDHASDAMLLADDEGRYVDANPGACAMLGYTREELIGKTGADVMAGLSRDAFLQQWKQFIAQREASGEVQVRRKDGGVVDVEFRAVAGTEPGLHLSVLRDVTERRLAEQRALRAQRMESLGTLAGGIAHDLNNALTPILLSVEMLQEGEPDERRQALLGTIDASARRGANMVRQVLSFARGVEGQRVAVSIAHALRDVERIANDTFLKHIQVRVVVAPNLTAVSADPTQVHQVLLNLCVNARDAMPSGGTLTLTAENVDVDPQFAAHHPDALPGNYVVVTVEDTGTGIPTEIVGRIFDPFFTTKAVGEGTGLGLPTSLAIVRSHGGFIRVLSEPGKGTRFYVYFPAQEDGSDAGRRVRD